MKLFYFNPNSYGQQYFIQASTEKEAINKLLNYFRQKRKNKQDYGGSYYDKLREWNKALKNNELPYEYTMEIIDKDEVFQTEIS